MQLFFVVFCCFFFTWNFLIQSFVGTSIQEPSIPVLKSFIFVFIFLSSDQRLKKASDFFVTALLQRCPFWCASFMPVTFAVKVTVSRRFIVA